MKTEGTSAGNCGFYSQILGRPVNVPALSEDRVPPNVISFIFIESSYCALELQFDGCSHLQTHSYLQCASATILSHVKFHFFRYSSDAWTCHNLVTWVCPKTRLMIAYAPPKFHVQYITIQWPYTGWPFLDKAMWCDAGSSDTRH